MKQLAKLAACACFGALCLTCGGPKADARSETGVHMKPHKHAHEGQARRPAPRRLAIDRSGRVQTGKASVYSAKLNGKRMANGESFKPASNTAASRTLPLDTVATVTNLQNGRSATVRICDRGPFRTDRILDVSPGVGERLGIGSNGIATVTVVPVPASLHKD